MIPAIKAEVRKIFTVRSTYLILAFVALLEIFFAFYVGGWHQTTQDLQNPLNLASEVTSAISAVAVFAALIATLLITHEYRFNTIMHTLTLSNSRSKVLLAKILVISGFSLIFTLIVGGAAPLLAVLGANLHHLHMVPQIIDHKSLLWRGLFFGWGYSMVGLLLAVLIRNQIGAIIALFIAPDTIEGLLSLLLKKRTVYLPFTALHSVLGEGASPYLKDISHARAVLIFGAYLLVGWIVAWVMFLRRDAN